MSATENTTPVVVDLGEVRRTAARLRGAEVSYRTAIVEASRAGATDAQIAAAAGVSRQAVAKMRTRWDAL